MLTSLISNLDVTLKSFQVRNQPATKAKDRAFRSICREHSQSRASRLVSVVSRSGFCVPRGTAGPAVALEPCLRTHVLWLLSMHRAGWSGHPMPIRCLDLPRWMWTEHGLCHRVIHLQTLSRSRTQLHLCFSTSEMPSKASTCGHPASQPAGDAAHPNTSSQEPNPGAQHTTGFNGVCAH